MQTTEPKPSNEMSVALAERMLAEILAEVLRRGFFGKAGVEISVQDGTIQTVRRTTERIERAVPITLQPRRMR